MYIIFEGTDGAGKTTTMKAVAAKLKTLIKDIPALHLTHHPGSTQLGVHLRQLVKFPESINPKIKIDNLSRQLIYMVDTINFIKQLLEPALEAGEWVFADRSSHISALVYGLADGLKIKDVEKLLTLISPPRADRLYVLRCSHELAKERLQSRGEKLDYFDKKPPEFFERVEELYENLITDSAEVTMMVSNAVDLENIVHIDSYLPLSTIVDKIVNDIVKYHTHHN